MGVHGEFVFTTKMLFVLLLLTPTSFGEVKFWAVRNVYEINQLKPLCLMTLTLMSGGTPSPRTDQGGTPWSAEQDFLTLPLGPRFMDKRKVPE